jgi:ankyrin repeat protein
MSDQRRGKGQPQSKEQAKTKSKAGNVEAMTDAELNAILATAFDGLVVTQKAGGSWSGSGGKKGNRAEGGGGLAAPSKQDLPPVEAPPAFATTRRKATGPLMLMDPATQCSACWGWPRKPRQCGRCELVSYCDKQCQEWDWRKHKPNCLTMEEQAAKKAINEELYWTCRRGQLRSVRQLLAERGANANYFNDDGDFPLFGASQEGHLQVVDALLEAGAQVNATRPEDSCTALIMACQYGKVAVVKSLVRAGANVNQTTSDRYADSPLIKAAIKGHVQIVDVLVAAGARHDYTRPCDGCTALHMACRQGFVDVVRSLLAAGADPRLALHNGFTPLAMAMHCNHPAVADLIETRLAELATTSAGSA